MHAVGSVGIGRLVVLLALVCGMGIGIDTWCGFRYLVFIFGIGVLVWYVFDVVDG